MRSETTSLKNFILPSISFLPTLSHLTILRPQDSETISFRIATDSDILVAATYRDIWKNRREFIFAALLFCLHPGNIWRFPKQMFLHGRGTFVTLYVIFMLVCTTSLMFFEVALGQYSSRGFSKVFAMCPVFEGISYAMSIYCVVVTAVYNHWNIFNFHYLIAGLSPTVPFKNGMNNKSGQYYEEEYFQAKIVKLLDTKGKTVWFNFINLSILILIWGLIVIISIKRTNKRHKVIVALFILTAVSIFTLLITACVSFPDAAKDGLGMMFVAEWYYFKDRQTWVFSFEQSLIAMGMGMGPLINLGSFSRFRSPAHRDCLYIILATLTLTLMFGMVIATITAQLALEQHLPLDMYMNKHLSTYNQIEIHVLLSQMFSRLPNGASQIVMVLFYATFFAVSVYCTIEYTNALQLLITSTVLTHYRHRVNSILLACCVSAAAGVLLLPSDYYYIHTTIDKTFIGLPVLIMVTCELIAVAYLYSVYNFCDDIEFMLGFVPNFFYQISWLCLPILLTTFMVMSIIVKVKSAPNFAEVLWCILILILIFGPIFVVAIIKIFQAHRQRNVASVFGPRDLFMDTTNLSSGIPSDTTIARYFRDLERKLQQSAGNEVGLSKG